ncbi:MAG TPA: hypothetical protein VFO35_09065, partial [Steroidobacteraceae bacterium]|nr:hypothetical protein [Steroidobacteraceae bacterium]
MFRRLAFAMYLILVAASAASAPVIDEDTLRASLKKGAVKVVSLTRHLGPPEVPDGAFARACRGWNLTEAQVLSFFSKATAISPDDLRSSYSVLPCQHSGAISIGATRYQFSINIGRFGFIRGAAADSVALFGCETECKELFAIDAS